MSIYVSYYLEDRGLEVGRIDPTLFTKRVNREIFVCQLYVDDIIFGSTNNVFNEQFAKLMTDMFKSMMGELKLFLGFEIRQLQMAPFSTKPSTSKICSSASI
jgi:hypothetical protein